MAGNVGGFTVLLTTITVLASRILLRRYRAGRTADSIHHANNSAVARPRFLGHISPAALKLLVETKPTQFLGVQIHGPKEPPLLPAELTPWDLHLTSDSCGSFLASPPQNWLPTASQHASGHGTPRPAELVCLSGRDKAALRVAANVLACNGFHRVTITTWPRITHTELPTSPGTSSDPRMLSPHTQLGGVAVDLQFISRDAVAVLTGQHTEQGVNVPHVLLDVRRHDERLLFGAIRGSVHIPVEQLPAGLEMPAEEFAALYRFAKPQPGLPIVLYSRTGRRASWAAQLCADAGLWPVYVYRQGVCGWRLDSQVKPYAGYRQGDLPPEPSMFQVERPDEGAGVAELVTLGLLPSPDLPMHMSGRHLLVTNGV